MIGRQSTFYAARKLRLRLVTQIIASALVLWGTALACQALGTNRSTAAMLLLLVVLGIATRGDWILALLSSTVASLAFSFYFIDDLYSLHITTVQGVITFCVMAVTALTGSRLSIMAHRRTGEAIRRREEVERLNQLGRILLSANSLSEAAGDAVHKVVELFGLQGAVLRVTGEPQAFQYGTSNPGQVSIIPLDNDYDADVLELHGAQPSEEGRKTIAAMIRLVLERARSAEERARMEAIRRGDELRTTVLNAMAHNLKTPLTSIKAAASMLRASGRISAPESELVIVIDEEADRLNELIVESIDQAKLEARRANPMMEECALPQIIGRVAARMSRYFGRREFMIELPEDMPTITGDSFLFEQMLVQVVDNAWKYSQPGAPIRISGEVGRSSVVLTVWNEGSQIPEDERDRIFDRFYRGSKGPSQGRGFWIGTGDRENHCGSQQGQNVAGRGAIGTGISLRASARGNRERHGRTK